MFIITKSNNMFLKQFHKMKKTNSHHKKLKKTVSFYECIRAVLIIFRILGLLPLNIEKRKPDDLRIFWKTPYNVFIYIPSIGFAIFIKIVQMNSFSLGTTKPDVLLFFFMIFLEQLLILRLCVNFKNLITKVESIEKLLPAVKRPKSFSRFVKRFVLLFSCLGIGEILVTLLSDIDKTSSCYLQLDGSVPYMQSLMRTRTGGIFEIFPFSYTLAIIVEVHKFQSRMAWYLCDVLIMIICIYLNKRMRDFNQLIIQKEFSFQKSFRPSWSILQVYYTRISRIVAIVDDHINGLIFISYAYNLYHLCMRVYYFLNKLTMISYYYSDKSDCNSEQGQNLLSNISNFYMAAFLLLRLVMVSHLAAELHNSSRKPLDVLHTVPSADYDCDMQRLMEQVYHSKVGVSGLRFFQITRGVLLAMIAKIMTYELVVIQFNVDEINTSNNTT